METVRMAVAALRSAADDLRKSDQFASCPITLDMAGRIIADRVAENSLSGYEHITLRELGLLVGEFAQNLENELGRVDPFS